MAKIIRIELDTIDATFTVDLTGYKGKGCGAIIEAFAGIGKCTTQIHKPEWEAKTSNLQGQGLGT
jgi:hypothetical protein